jgi:hypothetical protein
MKLSGKNITLPLARRIVGLPGVKPNARARCMGNKLRGTHPAGRAAAIEQFVKTSPDCKIKGK